MATDVPWLTKVKTEIEDPHSGYQYVRTLIADRKRLLADLSLGDFEGDSATDDYRSCERSLEQSIRDLQAIIEKSSGTRN